MLFTSDKFELFEYGVVWYLKTFPGGLIVDSKDDSLKLAVLIFSYAFETASFGLS